MRGLTFRLLFSIDEWQHRHMPGPALRGWPQVIWWRAWTPLCDLVDRLALDDR